MIGLQPQLLDILNDPPLLGLKIGGNLPMKKSITIFLLPIALLHLIEVSLSPLLLNLTIHLHADPVIPFQIQVPQLLH